eukprot:CAMPEP_0185740938 /NCGR_PEP_ID=MMETSP1171-20130828/38689_1 /TAXON_ID=374046 /ORGANISM="Helicotheca tamensis, Strain CCMP826" /LENGTH=884 /DNA_ID=CAMNT_0028412869 /DNA_START=107 /DNA_END=2761 /DNA_ORIENTATION=+
MIISRIKFLAFVAVAVFRATASNTDSGNEPETLSDLGADGNIVPTSHVTDLTGADNIPNFFVGGLELESNMGNDVKPLDSGDQDLAEAMVQSFAPPEANRRRVAAKLTKRERVDRRKKRCEKRFRRPRWRKYCGSLTSTTTTNTPTKPPYEVKDDNLYHSSELAPFDVSLRHYNSAVVEGYPTCNDLRDDILTAARIQANAVIMQQAEIDYMPTKTKAEPLFMAERQSENEDTAAEESAGDSEGFETNNQVKDVHEADVIKSNGKEIYSAYGDKVVVLNTTGSMLSEIVMPKLDDLGNCKHPPIVPYLEKNEENEDEEEIAEPRHSIGIRPPREIKPTVRSLLLHNNRLAVVVESRRNWCYSATQPILSDYGRTQIRLYDISDPTNLVLMGTRDLQGTYREGRRIANHAHFVSVTHVNTWSVTGPLYRWRGEFNGLNDTEYIFKATEIATHTTEDFADRLVKEMDIKDLDCANMAKISMWETGHQSEDRYDVDTSYTGGIINGYAQVTAVDMENGYDYNSTLDGTDTTLLANISGIFLRTSWVEVYASKTMLVLFGTGYQWNFRPSSQTTYLCAFHLQNGTVSPKAIGSVPGDLLDQFSIDHKDNYLRVASTESGPWEWFDDPEEDGRRRWAQETNNRITVLEFPDEGDGFNKSVLEEVGFIGGLGERFERIFAVRYVGDFAYVVTFLRTDPFYIINMSDATNPTRVGVLKVSGFSNYLHAVDDDTLLAVGQEATDDGRAIGLQLSMFNVSNSSDPTLLSRFTVEEDDDSWSWSDAQFEHKAFRYFSSLQKIILPASIYGKNAFDGFLVFGINETNDIVPEFSISHTSYYRGCTNLQPRSIVVDKTVTTFKGNTVKNHDLMNGTKIWDVDLDENRAKDDCFWWW